MIEYCFVRFHIYNFRLGRCILNQISLEARHRSRYTTAQRDFLAPESICVEDEFNVEVGLLSCVRCSRNRSDKLNFGLWVVRCGREVHFDVAESTTANQAYSDN